MAQSPTLPDEFAIEKMYARESMIGVYGSELFVEAAHRLARAKGMSSTVFYHRLICSLYGEMLREISMTIIAEQQAMRDSS